MKTFILYIVLILTSVNISLSRNFSVSDINTDEFPLIKASFIAYDRFGNRLEQPSADDFIISENSKDLSKSVSVNCYEREKQPAANIVLMIDKSFSMNYIEDGDRRWKWVVDAAEAFVNSLNFVQGSSLCVVAFNDSSEVICEFTQSKDKILRKIREEEPNGATDYSSPYLDPVNGAIALLSAKPPAVKRLAVLLTDGNPNDPPMTDSIISELLRNNIQAYSLTMLYEMNPHLKSIAEASGGLSFEVWNGHDLTGIYNKIALDVQKKQYCELSWEAPYGCTEESVNRTAEISFLPASKTIYRYFRTPPLSIASLSTSKNTIDFSAPSIGMSTTRKITLTAINSKFIIDSITINPDIFFSIKFNADISFPVELQENDSIIIEAVFTQKDNNVYREAYLNVKSSPCIPEIKLIGGTKSVDLLSPDGDETFTLCDLLNIKWSGTDNDTPTNIELLTGHETKPILIAENIYENKFSYQPISLIDSAKIRVFLPQSPECVWALSAGGKLGDAGKDVFISKDDRIFCCGFFSDTASFADTILISNGRKDIFVAEIGRDGNLKNIVSFGSKQDDSATGIIGNGSGDLYITGTCGSGIIFDKQAVKIKYGRNSAMFTLKLDESLRYKSHALIEADHRYTMFNTYGISLTAQCDTIIAKGKYISEFHDSKINLENVHYFTSFCAAYSADLKLLSALKSDIIHDNKTESVAMAYDNSEYRCGRFYDNIQNGYFVSESRGGSDMILSKYVKAPVVDDESADYFSIIHPTVSLSTSNYTFDDCSIGTKLNSSQALTIYNASAADIEFIRYQTVGTDAAYFSLEPNEQTVLHGYDSITFDLIFSPKKAGQHKARLLLLLNCADTLSVNVSGFAVCDLDYLPKHDFGTSSINRPQIISINSIFINNNQQSIFINPRIKGEDVTDFIMLNEGLQELDPGEIFNAEFIFTPTATGIRKAEIQWNVSNSCHNISSEISGNGIISQVHIPAVNWKYRRVKSINDTTINIRNTNSIAIVIDSMFLANDDDNFSILSQPECPLYMLPGESAEIKLRFNPLFSAHTYNFITLNLRSNDSLYQSPINGIAVIPEITLNSDCGDKPTIGKKSLYNLDIINPSENIDLHVYDIQFNSDKTTYNVTDESILREIIIPPAGTHSVLFEHYASSPGFDPIDFTITCDAADAESKTNIDTLTFKSGCDVPGLISNVVNSIDSASVCNEYQFHIIVENPAALSDITMTQLTLNGDDKNKFSYTGATGIVIPALSSHTFTVLFNSEETGNYTCKAVLSFDKTEDLQFDLNANVISHEIYMKEYTVTTNINAAADINLYCNLFSEGVDSVEFTYDMKVRYYNKLFKININDIQYDKSKTQAKFLNFSQDGILSIKCTGKLPVPYNDIFMTIPVQTYFADKQFSVINIESKIDGCPVVINEDVLIKINENCSNPGQLLNLSEYDYFLDPPMPNPAHDRVILKFGIAKEGKTKLSIYDILGREVFLIINTFMSPMLYDYEFSCAELPSGTYHIVLESGSFRRDRTLTIIN